MPGLEPIWGKESFENYVKGAQGMPLEFLLIPVDHEYLCCSMTTELQHGKIAYFIAPFSSPAENESQSGWISLLDFEGDILTISWGMEQHKKDYKVYLVERFDEFERVDLARHWEYDEDPS